MEPDNLIIFEMFPDVPYRGCHISSLIEHANNFMRVSKNPVIISAIEHRHPLQATLGVGVFPKGYLLVEANNETIDIVAGLPQVFDKQILPELKRIVRPDNCLDEWMQTYKGRGLGLLKEPSKRDRFLYSCLGDLQINHYNPQISQNAIALLERFGGKREIRALGELAAYAGLEHRMGFMFRERVCAKPNQAWSRIRELYNLD